MCDKTCGSTCGSQKSCSNDNTQGSFLPDLEDLRPLVLSDQDAHDNKKALRSQLWFNIQDDKIMSALYLERYLNYGLTREELMSGKPIIGIAQSGSDLAPCNRYHVQLAKRIRDGIYSAGGIAIEFPVHPIQESTRRPTAALDRNLSYLGLVETLTAYPFDGVVLLTGCDKTTPAALMAAATVNIPAIAMNVGPMLNGWANGKRVGAGTVIWEAREKHRAGVLDDDAMLDMITSGTPSPGHCNTMGTASTMNAVAEALGMALPGSAAIPAVYQDRGQCAYNTGKQIVEMVHSDRKPSDIMTLEAFKNAIVVNTAVGGSSNAPIHIIAIAKHMGVGLTLDDFDTVGYKIPLLLNMQPAGEMLSEDYFRAGGLPAILAELLDAGALPHPDSLACNGKSIKENVVGKMTWDRKTIKSFNEPRMKNAGFMHLRGSLFNSAIMKTSVISDQFRHEFLSDPNSPNEFTCPVVVFDGPEHYHATIDKEDSGITKRTMLIMRGVGPLGYPGSAEVVNMAAPKHLLMAGITKEKASDVNGDGHVAHVSLPCLGDGRQSGTSGSPSILNACPEAAAGGNLALVCNGDLVRVNLNERRVDLLVSEDELKCRRDQLDKLTTEHGNPFMPKAQTPWQEMFRNHVEPLSEGMVIREAVKYQGIAQKFPAPRHNH